MRYRGDAVMCNCCGGKFSQFLPYGNVKRADAVCPRCNALERNRVLWHFLNNELKISEKKWKVLHFAPEKTIELQLKKRSNLEYFGADLNPQLADYVVDITKIPFDDNTFDLIICAHVLGHVPDEGLGIRELKRVLKPSGLAIVMTVINLDNPTTYENPAVQTPAEKLAHYGEDDLVRLHGRDFGDRLTAQGFKVEAVDYRLQFSEADRRKYGLGSGEREVLFLCRKK